MIHEKNLMLTLRWGYAYAFSENKWSLREVLIQDSNPEINPWVKEPFKEMWQIHQEEMSQEEK